MAKQVRPGLEPVPKDAPDRPRGLAELCARAAYETRGEDIRILRVEELCSYADYFVVATGRNRRQLRAMAEETEDAMERSHLRKRGVEGLSGGEWILLDYGDVIVHLFDPSARAFYQIEEIWADAPTVSWRPPPSGG